MTFNNIKVRMALLEEGMTQGDLAKRLGKDDSTVSRLLKVEQPEDEQAKLIEIIKGGNNGKA